MIEEQKNVEANIQDSILCNGIGPISIGSKGTLVLEHLGEPEVKASSSRRKRPDLWKYGDVEIFFNREEDFNVEYIKFRLFPGQNGVNGWGRLTITEKCIIPGMPFDKLAPIFMRNGLNMTETEYPFDEKRLFLIGATEILFEGKGPRARLHSIYLK